MAHTPDLTIPHLFLLLYKDKKPSVTDRNETPNSVFNLDLSKL